MAAQQVLQAQAIMPHTNSGANRSKAKLRVQRRPHWLHHLQLSRRRRYCRVHARLSLEGWPERDGVDGRPHPFLRRHPRSCRSGRQKGDKDDKENEAPPPASDADRAKLRESQLAKCVQLRKMYNDAGVNIHIHKSPSARPTRTSTSISRSPRPWAARRSPPSATTSSEATRPVRREAQDLGRLPQPHEQHSDDRGHRPADAVGEYVGFNFDIGHYVAGTKGKSPIPVIEKYHEKIISLHLKDRTADGGNVPWGQGQTPIKEVLQLLKKEKWPIYADIELEYKVPEGSTVAEVAEGRRSASN